MQVKTAVIAQHHGEEGSFRTEKNMYLLSTFAVLHHIDFSFIDTG